MARPTSPISPMVRHEKKQSAESYIQALFHSVCMHNLKGVDGLLEKDVTTVLGAAFRYSRSNLGFTHCGKYRDKFPMHAMKPRDGGTVVVVLLPSEEECKFNMPSDWYRILCWVHWIVLERMKKIRWGNWKSFPLSHVSPTRLTNVEIYVLI